METTGRAAASSPVGLTELEALRRSSWKGGFTA